MTEIIPAIMPRSYEDLNEKAAQVERYVKAVQIDIMDGIFVRGKTWPYGHEEMFETLIAGDEGLPFWEKLDYEIDLMVKDPEDVVENWIQAGASRLIIHVESTNRLKEIIENTRGRVEVALALGINTRLDVVSEYLEDIVAVQFMGIETIGRQGEPFAEQVVDKIREFHSNHPEILISVDGGVSADTAPVLVEVGVKRLVCGSAIFNSSDVKGAIDALKSSVQ